MKARCKLIILIASYIAFFAFGYLVRITLEEGDGDMVFVWLFCAIMSLYMGRRFIQIVSLLPPYEWERSDAPANEHQEVNW